MPADRACLDAICKAGFGKGAMTRSVHASNWHNISKYGSVHHLTMHLSAASPTLSRRSRNCCSRSGIAPCSSCKLLRREPFQLQAWLESFLNPKNTVILSERALEQKVCFVVVTSWCMLASLCESTVRCGDQGRKSDIEDTAVIQVRSIICWECTIERKPSTEQAKMAALSKHLSHCLQGREARSLRQPVLPVLHEKTFASCL